MATLAQLLASHGSILVLDAVSLRVQIGLLRREKPSLWQATSDEAGRGLFKAADRILTQAGLGLEAIDCFIFCEGPGSMLGTRTVAMALRTWCSLKPRPVYAYSSLAMAGAAEWHRLPRSFTLLADARRESWHTLPVANNGTTGALTRLPTADLPEGELLTPAGFRAWSQPPAGLAECSYALDDLFGRTADLDLLQPTALPDVLQHQVTEYKKWTAQPHSAEWRGAQ